MLTRTMWLLVLAASVFLPGARTALAQTGGGAIAGTVKDATGGALPGVTVVVESPALIEKMKTAVTGVSGEYLIIDLRPGAYTVTFSLPAFKTVRREGIALSTSLTATVNATMEVGSVEETVTVTGGVPLVDLRSGVSEKALDQELLEGVPTGRNAYQIGLFMPGATTTSPDVGGNQTAQITNLSIHGSAGVDITWSADGLDITGNNGNGGLTATYYNEGFNQEVSIQTKALPAEIGSGGINVNMVKKQGSNRFSGDAHVSFTGENFQWDNVTDEQRELGLIAPSRMDRAEDINVTVGGPIMRDKLWFATSYRRWRVDRFPANTFNVDGSQATDEQLLLNYSASMTYQINGSNRLSGFYEYLDKIRDHRRDRTSDYQFIAPEASYLQPNNGPTANLKWTSTIRNNLIVEGGFSVMYLYWGLNYRPEIAPDALSRNDITLSTLVGAAQNELTREELWRRNIQFAVSWLPNWKGSHNIRVGGQYGPGMPLTDSRGTGAHGDLGARYRNGVPDSVIVFNTPVEQSVTMWEHALFAQDSWTIKNRVTVNFGLRADFFRGRVDAQEAPAGTFIGARKFEEINDAPNWKTVVPRLAFVFDVFGTGRTAVKWNISKYSRREATGIINNLNPMRLNNEIRAWTDANNDGVPQLTEIGVSRGTLERGATVRLDPDLKRPHQWEYTATLEHQLAPSLAINVSYFRRNYYDIYSTINAALSPSDYTPVSITNPLTGEPFTVYNQNPDTVGRVDNVVSNSDARTLSYDGFEIAFDKRMANNFMLFGGFTISANKECGAGAASTNPNDQINACGYAQFDSKYMTNVSGIYRLPYGFNASGHLQYVTGKPLSRTFTVTRAHVPNLTQVNQPVVVAAAGDVRTPSWTLLDFRLSKEFGVGRVKLEPLLDIYNITNENAPLRQVEAVGPALGQISENIEGRLIRVGARIIF